MGSVLRYGCMKPIEKSLRRGFDSRQLHQKHIKATSRCGTRSLFKCSVFLRGLTWLSIRLRVNTWTTRQCRSRRIEAQCSRYTHSIERRSTRSQKQNKNKRKR